MRAAKKNNSERVFLTDRERERERERKKGSDSKSERKRTSKCCRKRE